MKSNLNTNQQIKKDMRATEMNLAWRACTHSSKPRYRNCEGV